MDRGPTLVEGMGLLMPTLANLILDLLCHLQLVDVSGGEPP